MPVHVLGCRQLRSFGNRVTAKFILQIGLQGEWLSHHNTSAAMRMHDKTKTFLMRKAKTEWSES